MIWQPDPAASSQAAVGDDRDPSWPAGESRPGGPRGGRASARLTACAALLAVSICGLAVSAVGVAHQVLPRQFTLAQRRRIMAWEMERRWRALPAAAIFPETLSYELPAETIDATSGLLLHAHRLGISLRTGCAAAVTTAVARILKQHGCTAALRATYLDSSGSMVATIAVVVLPDPSVARTVVHELTASPGVRSLMLVRPLPVGRTPAAHFGIQQRMLAHVADAGPYLVLTTAGFADGRTQVQLSADEYLDQEMASLASGLAASTGTVLGRPPPIPTCPGAPGC